MKARLAWAALVLAAVTACGRGGGAAASRAAGAASSSGVAPAPSSASAPPPEVEALWVAAEGGEADDWMRLADGEGSTGLVEGAKAPARRLTAIRALAYVDDFEALPFLASVIESATADGGDAKVAAETVTALAARPRRATDPEDAASLRAGCDRLLAFARDPARPRGLRVEVVRALRMLSDRGCPKAADVPNDVNAAAAAR